MTNVSIDTVIAGYMKLRERKKEVEAKAKEEVSTINEKMTKLEAWIKNFFDETGQVSSKTPHGTAFLTTVDFAGVADWDAVLNFVKENEAYDMLTHSVSKTAVREYIKENKQVPPGVNYGTKIEVNIRKPSGGAE